MTLVPIDDSGLDQLALRFLDLSAAARNQAQTLREHQIAGFKMHFGKLNEWLEKLETWSRSVTADVNREVDTLKAKRMAQSFQPYEPKRRRKS